MNTFVCPDYIWQIYFKKTNPPQIDDESAKPPIQQIDDESAKPLLDGWRKRKTTYLK